MRVGFASVHWAEVVGYEDSPRRPLGYERITRTLLRSSARLPVRRVSLEVDSRVDRHWLAASTRFIRSLPGHDILTVYTYTTPQGYDYVLDMLRGGTKYEELVIPRISELSPIDVRSAASRVWRSDARRGTLDSRLATRIKRHLAAEKEIDMSTDTAEKEGYEAWYRATGELVHLASLGSDGARFRKRVYASFVRHEWSKACVFTHAARVVTAQFKRAFPYLTADAWRAILEQFVRDLDAVFARAPPVPSPFVVFRGLKRSCDRVSKGSAYTSTTMRRDVAMHFTDERAPIVEEITVPRGARPIALCTVSRYTKEAELLLPRLFAS